MMTDAQILSELGKIGLTGKVIESQEAYGQVWSHAVDLAPPSESAYLYVLEGGEGDLAFWIFDYRLKKFEPVSELSKSYAVQKTTEFRDRWQQANAA